MMIVYVTILFAPALVGIGSLVWLLFLRDWLNGEPECLICNGDCRYERDPDSSRSYNLPPDVF